MGCMMVKRAPDPQREFGGLVVKPVYSLSGIGNETKRAKKGQKSDDAVYAANRKLARYTAKFDPRVTAKYDLKALIGKGMFSRVVRVEHKTTGQPYAIKIIDRKRGKDVVDAELNVLLRVQHPYIVRLVEVFENRDKRYMVVDLATGGELFDRIVARGSFTERDAVGVLKMVIEALRHLHDLGVTHRDLKPQNILYSHPGPDSKIVITDFGLSALRKKSDEYMYTLCGTPEYISPEVLARHPYTSQVDMWAVGVISYILLSGTLPFEDENRPRLYGSILKAQYSYNGKDWDDISSNAKNFINGLLTVNPKERMTAVSSLQHPWLTSPAQSSNDLMDRQSSSDKSARSNRSTKSGHSVGSSERRRVKAEDVAALHRDPEVKAELSSHHGSGTKSSIELQQTSLQRAMATVEWGYDESDTAPGPGPSRWVEVAPAALGHHQSPVVIVPSEAEYDARLADNPIRISYDVRQFRKIHNNGRTVQVNLDDAEDPEQQSKISGGPMEVEHPLKQFHFHWGSKSSSHGSEHRVEGKMYAAELHFVHWNSGKYSSFEEAFKSKDGIVVLAIFMKAGREHKSLNMLTKLFDKIPFPEDHVTIPNGFDPYSLFPGDMTRYWTYSGSVTAPPCHESVRFIIFRESIDVSEEQLNAFRSLRPLPFTRQVAASKTTDSRLANNFRPTMPLNDRKIQASFQKASRTKKSRDAEKRQKRST